MTVDYDDITKLVASAKPIILDHELASQVTEKGRADYVTQVDYAVQAYMVEQLRRRDSGAQFLCEEGDHEALDWDRPIWILDPVDGTTNLIHGFQHSAVSLGLWNGSRLEYGCVYNPFREELFCAVRGKGAYLNGRLIHVSQADTLANSLIIVGTSPWDKTQTEDVFGTTKRIFRACQDVRRTGSAALDCCYVACGRADGFCERNLKPWDYAAGALLVEEAGGRFTDQAGQTFRPDRAADLTASNGLIHDQLIACLRQ